MSKIGRKAIALDSVKVDIKGNEIDFKGPKNSGTHMLPDELQAHIDNNALYLTVKNKAAKSDDINKMWGLHRALLANKIKGASAGFEKLLLIDGLGFKAALSGSKIVLNLGYSHKIDFDLPKGVALEIDKTGQKLTFKSADKELIGQVCSLIKALRPTEPYKGTGIRLSTETVVRKAGKTKSA
jgi:large subunit ribosomal protein L6